ncbi:Uncharacterised protein [Klebsiella pneumoniae]|nr:Uncharacterised protein [Klebsiella pneumoniae]SVS60760.1 Uncharacterised protein [Klebsiella pneumoniae]
MLKVLQMFAFQEFSTESLIVKHPERQRVR